MFQIQIIASSSAGNAYAIHDGDKTIIIDPGIRIGDIRKALDFGLSRVDMCLLTHEHQDHSKSIGHVSRYGVPCYMSLGTFEAVSKKEKLMMANICASEVIMEHNGWSIIPFDVIHDAAEPLGFLIKSPSGKKIMFATDTYYIEYSFREVTHYVVECNHREKLLYDNEDIDERRKNRVRMNHFELSRVKKFFESQDLSRTERIDIIHLSAQNADRKLFIEEVASATGVPVYA